MKAITSGRSMDWERKNFSWKSDFSSLSEWTLPMPETKIWDHFSIQIYPLLVGNMASETTFGHWKVVFSWGKGRKMTFSQNPLSSRFWASGFWMSILSSANFKKDPPWYIFSLSVHAPATSGSVKRKFGPFAPNPIPNCAFLSNYHKELWNKRCYLPAPESQIVSLAQCWCDDYVCISR